MSLDEGSGIHENSAAPMRRLVGGEGTWLHYAWVLAGAAVVLLVVAVLFRFWWNLPNRTRFFLALAAVIYVAGALGFEMIGGYVRSTISDGLKYSLFVMLEESFEMLGASTAIYALLNHLRSVARRTAISVVLPHKTN